MKKLLIGLLFSVCAFAAQAEAAPMYGYVQISTGNHITPPLQTGAINVSSATIRNLNVTFGVRASTFTGNGAGLTNVPDIGGSTNYVQISNSLQASSTFYVSSGTVQSLNSNTINATTGTFQAITVSTVVVSSATFQTLTSTTIIVSSGTVETLNTTTLSVAANQGYVLYYSSTVYDTSGSSGTTVATFVPTRTSITLTPKRTTSRIEISVSGSAQTANGSLAVAYVTLLRGSTNLAVGGTPNAFCGVSTIIAQPVKAPCSFNIIDLPSTTSAVTYRVAIKTDAAGTAATWGAGELGTITVKEWSY